MKGAIALRNPVGAPAALDTSSTNVTSSAYVQLIAALSMTSGCSAIALHNPGAQPLKLAKGGSGSEVDTGIVLPVGAAIIIPIELAKNTRLSLKSMGGTQSTGIVTCSFLA